MKAIVFQGQSQYDVLRNYSAVYAQELQKYGVDSILCDMNLVDSNRYFEIAQNLNPDFTIGFNPVVFYSNEDNMLHYQKTDIPHIIRLGDNPFYHAYDRALRNPNDPNVYTVAPQRNYEYAFKQLGFERYSILSHVPATQSFKVNFENKIFPTVFFGSYTNPEKILNRYKEVSNSNQVFNVIRKFCEYIKEYLENEGTFLRESIEFYFSNFVYDEYKLDKNQIKILTKEAYYTIDQYYRNLVREKVLMLFAGSGLEMVIFGREDTKKLLERYPNVKVYSPVNYHDYLNVIAHSKVSLNISPMFKSSHERITTALFNSTLLCTNIMEDLIERNNEIMESSLFYNLNTITETVETITEIVSSKLIYNDLVETGLTIAKKSLLLKEI